MLSSLLSLLVALLTIWSLGYILVVRLGPGLFRPRPVEGAVALLVGLCAAGLFTMVTAHLAPNALWFQRAIRWTVPLLVALGATALALKHRGEMLAALHRIADRGAVPTMLLHGAARSSSVGVLLLGTAMLMSNRPAPPSTVELYGEQIGQRLRVSVTSTAERAQQFVLVVRSETGEASEPILLEAVSAITGPVTATLAPTGLARIELYQSAEDVVTGAPMRWISVDQRSARP